MATEIVVVGGGSGGTIAANELTRELRGEIRRGEVRVTLVAAEERHYFQPAFLHVAFKGLDPSKIWRPEGSLLRREVKLLLDPASSVDLDDRVVRTESGRELRYDHLVLATGSVPDPGLIPGMREANMDYHSSAAGAHRIWEAINRFRGGRVVMGVGAPPYKCPPSPDEGAFLADEFFRRRGIRDRVRLTVLTPYLFVSPSKTMAEIISPLMEERGIEKRTLFNVDSVDPERRVVYSMEGDEVGYDLLILVPPHRGADVVRRSGIGDEDGWVPADKYTMEVRGYDDAFAIGDCTDIPAPKTGVTAHLQGVIVAKNLASDLRGTGVVCRFTGRSNCPYEVGFGRATFVVGTYDKPLKKIRPSRLNYLQKKLFMRIYWSSLRGTWDWLFDLYFGEDARRCSRDGRRAVP